MLFRSNDDRVKDIFALVVYGTLIFPQSLGYIDAAIVDLIEQIDNQVNPVPTIIVEIIRSLNYCRRKGERNFIGCAPQCKFGSGTIFGASVKRLSDSA